MDCMILQGAFAVFYLAAVLGDAGEGVEGLVAAASRLSNEDMLRFMRALLDTNRS
uniref:Uncharacterized protein n=1 Tax=viral metagenome TaxID=1070528 RepID=A0A6C0KBG9_9ZZZZ